MRSIFPTIFLPLVFLACGQANPKEETKNNDIFFRTTLSPSFEERADVIFSKTKGQQMIKFLLLDAYSNDKPADTFYFKEATLSESQFLKLDSGLFKKILTAQSIHKNGMRDGIGISFTYIHNEDTSTLTYQSPAKGIDTAAYELTKFAIDNFKLIFKDTIINDYLDDVIGYIDHSYYDTITRGNRLIDRLRRNKYSR